MHVRAEEGSGWERRYAWRNAVQGEAFEAWDAARRGSIRVWVLECYTRQSAELKDGL